MCRTQCLTVHLLKVQSDKVVTAQKANSDLNQTSDSCCEVKPDICGQTQLGQWGSSSLVPHIM